MQQKHYYGGSQNRTKNDTLVKTIVLEDDGGGYRTVVLSTSPREPTNASIWTHNENRGFWFPELETIYL